MLVTDKQTNRQPDIQTNRSRRKHYPPPERRAITKVKGVTLEMSGDQRHQTFIKVPYHNLSVCSMVFLLRQHAHFAFRQMGIKATDIKRSANVEWIQTLICLYSEGGF